MLSMARYSLARVFLLTAASLLLSNLACAQMQGSNERDIVERAPNVIKKIGPYGAEMMIESDSIVERTPCRPAYPQSSIKNGETGVVVFKLMLATTGFASRAKVVETSGFRDLDRAAMIGFLGCKFKPVLKDGVPAESWIDMRYVWEIK
jgi:TonB family protein